MSQYEDALNSFSAKKSFFVGFDSDGCVFDTMELKHKECFGPNIIRYWDLQPVSKYARECFEFVNLYSKWRGVNRWPALVKVMELLRERPEVVNRGAVIPQMEQVRAFIESGFPLSNSGLEAYMKDHTHLELDQAKAWTLAVNDSIKEMVKGVSPYPKVRESLQTLSAQADLVVVSSTPCVDLEREWQEHDLAQYMGIICGQEMGSKAHVLATAAVGNYPSDHILMIGDAPGDLKAAKTNQVLFFPINPGYEESSWERFYQEGMQKFLNGSFAGLYQEQLIQEFEAILPDTPPWKGK